jgi:aminopeptidase N
VEAGAVLGLGELADARAMAPIVDASRPERSEGLRRAATMALGRLGALVEEERTRVVAELEERLGDPSFMVTLDAIIASESLSDVRLLPGLERLAQQAVDGRMRRDAMEAAMRIRQGAKVPAQVKGMREDIDELREDQRRLQEKIEALARA